MSILKTVFSQKRNVEIRSSKIVIQHKKQKISKFWEKISVLSHFQLNSFKTSHNKPDFLLDIIDLFKKTSNLSEIFNLESLLDICENIFENCLIKI